MRGVIDQMTLGTKLSLVLIVFLSNGHEARARSWHKVYQRTGTSQIVWSLILVYKNLFTTHLGKENKYMSTKSFDQWTNENN